MEHTLDHNISDLRPLWADIDSRLISKVVINLSKVTALHAENLVLWKCIEEKVKSLNCLFEIVKPLHTDTDSILRAIGFYVEDSSVPEGTLKFTPLLKVVSDSNEILLSMCRDIFEKNNITISIIGNLASNLTELADNIFNHSGNTNRSGTGYVCGFLSGRFLDFYFTDIGCGFRGSYQRTGLLNNRTDEKLLEDSFTEFETCLKKTEPHRGIGLHVVAEYIKECSGEVVINSGEASLAYNGIAFQASPIRFCAGTRVKIRVMV